MARCIYSDDCEGCEYEDCINDEGICTMYEPDYNYEDNEDDDVDEE